MLEPFLQKSTEQQHLQHHAWRVFEQECAAEDGNFYHEMSVLGFLEKEIKGVT